ncbi:G-protein coupled receptor [Tasmannia lanceolata]|uniref:G-protein coupled receptor n=1 Tax=Tasmannia lanceolata TaxID=3420 RepID=UPI0040641D5B
MLQGGSTLTVHSFNYLFASLLIVIFLHAPWATAIVVPSSNCYVLDNSSQIFDFTDWIGHPFEYVGKDSPDLVVRFCKDVETRSQMGYVDFGRYSSSNHFVAGSGDVNFVQGFYNGDLVNCETSFDKMGRTAQVNIICGNCLNGMCKGELGCICNVTYDSTMCSVLVELAIPCEKHGSRVFQGFTVGFHPRSWEVVYNGLTQLGFEKARHEFSFGTEQTHVSLYMTAIASLSGLVGKPVFKVNPDKGLEVKLSGSGADGSPPTTLSPSTLIVNWRCEKAHDSPYEVAISIPLEGYEPIEFTLTKICEYRQEKGGDSMRGWATFGVLSFIFIVISLLFCCGGFAYKTRVEHQHGLDALPGMTILSACLETVTGVAGGYSQAENLNSAFINQTSWEHVPVSAQGTQRQGERKYGSI